MRRDDRVRLPRRVAILGVGELELGGVAPAGGLGCIAQRIAQNCAGNGIGGVSHSKKRQTAELNNVGRGELRLHVRKVAGAKFKVEAVMSC